jgi:hypothetical protein
MQAKDTVRGLLKLAGSLLVGGFLMFTIVTMAFHPSHDENNHPVIFGKYADSDGWVATHFGQFAGVLIALGGFLVLHRFFERRGQDVVLARLAFGATIATAAVWAALQAVDGTALKQATEAWVSASGAEKAARFADAETVRWTEWGLQSYFRLLMGTTFILFGTASVRSGIIARWAATAGIAAGVLYMAIGVAVGHSGFDQPGGPVVQLLMLTFVAAVLVAGIRCGREARLAPARP